ncbi:MAG: hypothetical protein ACFFDN_13990 [Candidatus Hodarchaeota archaeon]
MRKDKAKELIYDYQRWLHNLKAEKKMLHKKTHRNEIEEEDLIYIAGQTYVLKEAIQDLKGLLNEKN